MSTNQTTAGEVMHRTNRRKFLGFLGAAPRIGKALGGDVKRAAIGVFFVPIALMAQQTGDAWVNIGPTPAAVEAIAVGPHDSGIIFIGTNLGGVRRSVDGGITWSAVNTGLTNLDVGRLAIDASGPQTVYAGTMGGLFKTVDGGATWQNVPGGGTGFFALAADPSRPGVVYASVFINLSNGSIMKSTDGGATWTTVFPTTAAIYKIIIDPVNPDVLYLPTVGGGAWKSIDGGQHWSVMTALTPQAIWTMALDPANSQVLYAGTNQDGIWKSTDAGNTWQQAGSVGPFPVYSLAVDSSTHIVYAGTNGGGVWTGLHDGVTWRATTIADGMVLSLAVDSAGAVYAGTNFAGAKVSHDQGTTWTALNTGTDHESKSCYGIWIDPKNHQKIFIGNEAEWGLAKTQDGGAAAQSVGRVA